MLYVYKLTVAASRIERAFQRVSEAPRVMSCSIETGEGQVRFLAPASVGAALVEQIYAEGGLIWCSRHVYSSAPSEAAASA